jgi:WD40 repeat protein
METRKSPNGGTGFAPVFAFSEDGGYLAVGGCSKFNLEACVRGEMFLWEGDHLKMNVSPFFTRIQSLVFSPDNRNIAIAGAGSQVKLLDLRNRNFKEFLSLEAPGKIPPDDFFSIYDMVFLTDGKTLAVSTTDGIQLLEVRTLSKAPNLSFRLRLNYPYRITASGDNLNFRSEPLGKGIIIKKLHMGEWFNTVGGPKIADHQVWWKVKIADGTEGWILEMPSYYEFVP